MLAGRDSRDAVWANSLERLQRDILLEGLCELDDARHVLAVIGEVVGAQTAIEGTKPLGGRDSKGWVGGSVLDARKRLIDGECTRQMFGSHFLQ